MDLAYAVLAVVMAGSAYVRFYFAKKLRAGANTQKSRRQSVRFGIVAATRGVAACLFAIAAITSSSIVFVIGLVPLFVSILAATVFSFMRVKG